MTYLQEKFAAARRILMLPHPQGEIDSVTHALHEISQGLDGVDRATLGETLSYYVQQLEKLIAKQVEADPDGRHRALAKTLSVDERLQLSQLVDDIANCRG